MAFHDWNHDCKKDFADDFIEYQIYKQSKSNSNYTPRSGGGISTFGAIVATIGGLVLATAIVALLGGRRYSGADHDYPVDCLWH